MPRSTCLIVIPGRQSFSSSRMLRQTVPEGNIFGWKKLAGNLHLGGFAGYSSGNSIVKGNTPPAHCVPAFPGIPHCHFNKLTDPSGFVSGLAKNPKGLSFRHAFLSAPSLSLDMPADISFF